MTAFLPGSALEMWLGGMRKVAVCSLSVAEAATTFDIKAKLATLGNLEPAEVKVAGNKF